MNITPLLPLAETKLDLKDKSADLTPKHLDKDSSQELLLKIHSELDQLQEALYAQNKFKVLIVLQGLDTGGKDGTIRNLFSGMSPQGIRIASFKKPSDAEAAHDYLWRIHEQAPRKGEIVIFNRSHYEDLLVPYTNNWINKEEFNARVADLIAFESMLARQDTLILKFFLHISKDEQRKRLQARLDDPAKHWKFSVTDLTVRKQWDQYMETYRKVLPATSHAAAPWFVVPANHKWARNLWTSYTLLQAMKQLPIEYPKFIIPPKTKVV